MTPSHTGPDSTPELGSKPAAPPVGSPALAIAPAQALGVPGRASRTINEDIGDRTRGRFRSYREEVEQTKKAFSDSAFAMNSRVLVSSAGAPGLDVPKVNKQTGELRKPTVEDHQNLWDIRRPDNVAAGLEKALNQGKFRLFGQNNDLAKAISLPALFGYGEAASGLEPSKIADHNRTGAVRDYKALNNASPTNDPSGRLVLNPAVFDSPQGRREVFGFKNPGTGEVLVATPQGMEIELTSKVEFEVENGKLVRLVPEDGVYATYPFATPTEDGMRMIEDMAKKGFMPITNAMSTRLDLPAGVGDKGADTLAAEGLLRAAKGVESGALEAALRARAGDSLAIENLPTDLDIKMGKAWVTVARALEEAGLSAAGADRALATIAPALITLPRAETEFNQALTSNGAHRDPVFAIRNFLIERYGINQDTRDIEGVPIDRIRNILADRGTEETLIKDSGFNAAAQQATATRARKIDQIHEELLSLIPDLVLKDGNGKPVQAMEEELRVVEMVDDRGVALLDEEGKHVMGERYILVEANWSNADGRSDRPRFASQLDAVIEAAQSGMRPAALALDDLDVSVRLGKMNMANLMASVTASASPHSVPDPERFSSLLVAVGNRQPVTHDDRAWFDAAMARLRASNPALAELERTYLDGSMATANQLKINMKELERSGFAVGRIMEGRNRTPLASDANGTYSMPPRPTAWVTVLPENKEMTRFTGYKNKREIDGDYLGSEKDLPDRRGMTLDESTVYKVENSRLNARVDYTAVPRSEFVAPRDSRGFPVLAPGTKPVRVTGEQEQIAHAKRLPIFEAPDGYDNSRPHLFAFKGLRVDAQRGMAADLLPPGTYIPIFRLSEDPNRATIPRMPNSFGGINTAHDEVTFTTQNPSPRQVKETLLRNEPDQWDASRLNAAIDSLYNRRGRYAFPEQTFREGTESYQRQRMEAIGIMESFSLLVARSEAQDKVRAAGGPDSELGAQSLTVLESKENQIRKNADASRAGAEFIYRNAVLKDDKFGTKTVSGLVVLVGDGAGERGHNFMLAWESVQDMMRGPDSLTDLQSRGIIGGQVIKSRLD